ncbi:MAG: hypothetical protein HUU21_37930 [Polyangiaceae bacterium]|nr:hypothetical protein [Polyangiaceae bacterium]
MAEKDRPATRRDRIELNPEILMGKSQPARLTVEVVSSVDGSLTDLSPALLMPDVLPELWRGPELTLGELTEYFSGKTVIKLEMPGFQEKATVPRYERVVLESAVHEAVRTGKLWLMSGAASLLGERVPISLWNEKATLRLPPPPIPASDLSPESLPEAWAEGAPSGAEILAALAKKMGKPIPWGLVRSALEEAFQAGLLERTPDSGAFPCDSAGAAALKVRKPGRVTAMTGARAVEVALTGEVLKRLADRFEALSEAAGENDFRLILRAELGLERKVPDETVEALGAILSEIAEALRLR